jgi:hypothetical protein
LRRPFFANVSTISLLVIFVWALTLCNDMSVVRDCNIVTICDNNVLSGWLLCMEGCHMWVFIRYKEFRLSVKI